MGAFVRSAVALVVVFGGEEVRGDLIAYWHFNDSNLVVDQGAGTLTTSFLAGDVGFISGTSKNALAGVPALDSLRLKNDDNNGVGHADFALDTRGYQGLMMSFATQRSGTGFNSNQVAYSTNGGESFLDFGSPYDPPGSFDVLSFDLSGIAGLVDNADAIVRISFSGATGATGNNRFDNVQFNATQAVTATPEPASWMLAIFGMLGFGIRRWKHRGHREHGGKTAERTEDSL